MTAGTWAGVWRVVEFMLLVIWSGNHYKDKPVCVFAGAMLAGAGQGSNTAAKVPVQPN